MLSFHEFYRLKESLSLMKTSTGNGGGTYDNEEDDGDEGDEWNWDRMEHYRWNLLKWCGETESMKEISRVFGEFIERQRSKKVSYMVLTSKYPPPRYVLQLRYEFDADMSPAESEIRRSLEKSDLHKPLNIDQKKLYRVLENDEVREYMIHIICLHLSSDRAVNAGSPFTQSHFGGKKASPLSNYFSFNVWNNIRRKWDSKILPEMSEIAVRAATAGKIERPADWTKIGHPEVEAKLSDVRMPVSVTVYGQESGMVLSSVVAMIPFDWNRIQ